MLRRKKETKSTAHRECGRERVPFLGSLSFSTYACADTKGPQHFCSKCGWENGEKKKKRLENIEAWDESKAGNKDEVIAEAKANNRIVHFGFLHGHLSLEELRACIAPAKKVRRLGCSLWRPCQKSHAVFAGKAHQLHA